MICGNINSMDKKELIVLFDEEELTKTLIESYLKDFAFKFEVLKFNEFDETLIPNTEQKKIIIASVSKTNLEVFKKIEKLSKNKNNLFLVISYDKSADLQVTSLRNGAKDFLPKPLIQTDFTNSIMKIYKEEIMQNIDTSTPKIFTVSSKEKAVGKTFFALNFAKELADASKEKVLLIDFNNNLNDLSFLLNLNIKYNTPFFINKIDDSNAITFIKNLSRYKNSSLYIMANGNIRNEETKTDATKISPSLDILKKHFKYIVVDTDSSLLDVNIALYKKSYDVFFLITSSLTNAVTNSDYITKYLSNSPVKLVLNKFNPKKDELLVNKLEKTLGRQIFLKVPKNIVAISTAQSKFSTIKEVGEQLDVSKVYVQLANDIVGRG